MTLHRSLLPLMLAACLATGPAIAGMTAVNVAVIINADSWASKAVANEFIALRDIPARNVIYLADLPDFEYANVDTFRERILGRVLQTLNERGLSDHIDCVAWSTDIPSRISVRSDMKDQDFPKMITPTASINGLTYLYARVMAKDTSYLSLSANRYARLPEPLLNSEPLPDELREAYVAGLKLVDDEKWAEAAEALLPVAEGAPHTPDALYNTACALARAECPDDAMRLLVGAVEAGFLNFAHVERDKDLATLREREDFKTLVAEMKQREFEVQPTIGFRAAEGWDERGQPGDHGEHYLLSMVLGWTSGRGNSLAEVIECLRRSAAADGTAPPGTIYYMVNSNIRSQTRLWGFAAAIAKLRELGVAAEAIDGTLPKNRDDVAGLMAGSATFDWPASGSTLLPGAIAEHLTSCGGMVHEGASQTPITEFMRYGAAASAGTVTEPYAIQAKFPDPFVHVHYARGCTLAEAMYQSLRGPYQLLVIGDPLCRPWTRIPQVLVEGIAGGQTISGTVALRIRIVDDRPVARRDVYVDGVRAATSRDNELTLDTTALADGYHELRAVAVLAGDLQFQGEAIIPVTVRNRNLALEIAPLERGALSLDEDLGIAAQMPGATRILFAQGGRIVRQIEGASGTVEIPAATLGLGPVRINSQAVMADETRVAGTPVEVTVVSPEPMPGKAWPYDTTWVEGVLMTVGDAEPVVVESTRKTSWLKDLEVQPEQELTLRGHFDVPADEVCQFQVRADGPVTVTVDEREVVSLEGGEPWRLIPLTLGAGMHDALVHATTGPKLRLQVRFGGPGALSIGAPRFKHVANAE